MKHVRTFESIDKPRFGDYVICNETVWNNSFAREFISSNIGQIVRINEKEEYPYVVKYENIPTIIESGFIEIHKSRLFALNEILFFHKDKEMVKAYLQSNKYNL